MAQNIDEKAIISKLFISKETIAERLTSLVQLCQGLLNIVQETGEIYIEDTSNLNNNEKILIYLTGAYFAWRSMLRKDAGMGISELASKAGIPVTTASAPIMKLMEEHLVLKKEAGVYTINFDNFKFLREALIKIKRKKDSKMENKNE